VAALERGEVIVVPTDTVYGVAVSPTLPGGVDRVVAVKGRERTSPPPFLIGDIDQVWPLVAAGSDTDGVHALLDTFWPGGLTVVLPVNPNLSWDIGETGGTIAVRMPDEPVLQALLRLSGPLAVTSANLTGQPPCESAYAARDVFGDAVSVYLDAGKRGGPDGEQVPSTIVDLTPLVTGNGFVTVIRHGTVGALQLSKVLPGVEIR
jgi:L-threonylcarbamoyladenylate synthase